MQHVGRVRGAAFVMIMKHKVCLTEHIPLLVLAILGAPDLVVVVLSLAILKQSELATV